MKALTLLQTNVNYQEKAISFVESAKEACEELIRSKKKIVTSIEDKISDAEQSISVSTDINKGIIEKSREDVIETFKTILQLKNELFLTKVELKVYQESFDSYFTEITHE